MQQFIKSTFKAEVENSELEIIKTTPKNKQIIQKRKFQRVKISNPLTFTRVTLHNIHQC